MKLFLLITVILAMTGCGKEEPKKVESRLCMESCVSRNLYFNNGSYYEAYNYCEEFVLEDIECQTYDDVNYFY